MKNLLLFSLFFFGQLGYSQNDSIKKFMISINFNTPISFGNNFFNKSYENAAGFGITGQYHLKKIYFGMNFNNNYMSVSDTKYLGNFTKASVETIEIFIGIRQKLRYHNWGLEHQIGIGNTKIENYAPLSVYKVTGKSYTVGSRIYKQFSKRMSVFGGLDFRYTNFDVNIAGSYADFYKNSYQIIPAIGVKHFFGGYRKCTNYKF
jgi:hypothetical protein